MICICIIYLTYSIKCLLISTNDANIHIHAPLPDREYEQQPVPVLRHVGEYGQAPVLFGGLSPASQASAQYSHRALTSAEHEICDILLYGYIDHHGCAAV